jgi:phenylacetate-coenzyme A ligase PaaK-like adenylate-forming protein
MTSEAQSHFSRLQKEIFSVSGESDFERLALEIFQLQVAHVPIYKNYAEHLNVVPASVTKFADIPFLPIEFFKTHEVVADGFNAELEFLSSGTTGQQSHHFVASAELYRQSLLKGFAHRWGRAGDFCFLCLLPSYLERGNSSLVWMCNELVGLSNQKESGFYLDQLEELAQTIGDLEQRKIPAILFGVTFALLDLADLLKIELKTTSIIETGGMKGRGKELTRLELHNRLQASFGSQPIQSEYGMTELLSQAYTDENGLFRCPPWMKISIRDVRDPFALAASGKTGGVDVVDLANLYSCSFISTRDLGRMHDSGSFEIMGRFDNSDVRGCSLMTVD